MIDAGIFSTFIFMKKSIVLFGLFAASASFYGCGGDSKSSAPEEPVVNPVVQRCYEEYGFEENAEWSKMISSDSYLEKIVCDKVSERMSYMLSFYARCTKAKYDKSKNRFDINVLTERGDNHLWADVTGCKYKLGVNDNYQFNGFVADSPEFDFGECFCKTEDDKTYYRNINPELLKEDSSSSAESSSSGKQSSSSDKTKEGTSSSSAKGNSSSSATPIKLADEDFIDIGGQIWTAKNLNVEVKNSKCYDDDNSNCEKYGRMYTWAQAMNVDSRYDENELGKIVLPHQGICPEGTHLPSSAEWVWLFNYLETHTQYNKYFAEPVGGAFDYKGYYRSNDYETLFWSSTEYDARGTGYDFEYAWVFAVRKNESKGRDNGHKITGAYVRCLKNGSEDVLSSSSVASSSSEESSSSEASSSSFVTDLEWLKVGDLMWSTKNLDVPVEGSMCYDDEPTNCEKYGRIYTWSQAMAVDSKYDREKLGEITLPHQGICPDGSYLPSDDEWDQLYQHIKKNSKDQAYFTNQIGGAYDYRAYYRSEDVETVFWTSTEYDATGTSYDFEYAWIWAYRKDKSIDRSNPHKYMGAYVRCVKSAAGEITDN